MRKLIHNNLEECLSIILRCYGIRYSFLGAQLHRRHPLYPSFNSISYLLSRYGLDSSLVKVPINDLKKLESPVLVNYDGLILPIIDICNDSKIVIINEQLQRETIDIVLHGPLWDGTTLVIQRFEDNDIKSPLVTRKEIIKIILFKFIPIYASFTIFLYLIYTRIVQIALELTVWGWVLLISSMMGLFFSALLQIEVYDRANKWIGRICHSHSGNKRDCLSVLDSKGASVLGILSLTDVGTLVFISYLALFLLGNIKASISLVTLFSLLSLLFIPYSIYYQKHYVKKWCVLCLCVIGVLFINGITAIAYIFSHPFHCFISNILPSIKQSVIVLTGCYLLYWMAKYSIENIYFGRKMKEQRGEIIHGIIGKANVSIFGPQITTNDVESLSLKTSDMGDKIVAIVNPLCAPCIKKLDALLDIVNRKHYTSFDIIFLVDKSDKEAIDVAAKIVNMFFEDETTARIKLTRYIKFFPEYNGKLLFTEASEASLNILSDQWNWCSRNNINSTPTILLNGYTLPLFISPNDIDYLTE